mgnify:CR=1 FL=1
MWCLWLLSGFCWGKAIWGPRANEISRLNNEIEKYRAEYEENTERLNELAVDSGAIERIAREKYLMKKPNEDIYVFEEDIEK